MKTKKLIKAWNFLQDSLFLARPYWNNDGEIFTFNVDFHDAVSINLAEDGKWRVEFGCFYIKNKVYYTNVDDIFVARTYEKAIIKLAKLIKKKYSDELLHNYFHIDEDFEIKTNKISNGNVEITNLHEDKSGFDIKEVFNKIKEMERLYG